MENRLIKFRAWDDPGQRMHIPLTLSEIFEIGKSQELGSMGLIFKITFDSLKFMQFTGLLDKNGKEIYEGDIVKSTLNERWFDWEVQFRDGCFGAVNIGVDGYLGDFYPCNRESFFDSREVYGNIYENPNLLKPQPQPKIL